MRSLAFDWQKKNVCRLLEGVQFERPKLQICGLALHIIEELSNVHKCATKQRVSTGCYFAEYDGPVRSNAISQTLKNVKLKSFGVDLNEIHHFQARFPDIIIQRSHANGNLLTENAGIQVPLVVAAGYAF